jgi:hemerythrin-like domain-containing protein
MSAGPARIRALIRAEHCVLRALLREVGELARCVEDGRGEAVAALRERGLALHDRFAAHLALEEQMLVPWLRRVAADAADRLLSEHTEQRLLLEYILVRLRDAERPGLVLGRELRGFVQLLHEDMAEEEQRLLAAGPLHPV